MQKLTGNNNGKRCSVASVTNDMNQRIYWIKLHNKGNPHLITTDPIL